MAAKHIKEMTFKEIAENRQFDEAISCIMWEINKRQKQELSGKTMRQLASENKLGDVVELLERHIIRERNEAYTPRSAFEKIARFIPKNKVIWEAFTAGNHEKIQSPQYLRDLGFKVIAQPEDFFSSNYGDIVVSNPPYVNNKHAKVGGNGGKNMKAQVMLRLIKLDKPFMLLLPTFFLQTKTMQDIANRYGHFQYIIPTGRIKFSYYDKQQNLQHHNVPLFYTLWFCYKMNLEKDVIFI